MKWLLMPRSGYRCLPGCACGIHTKPGKKCLPGCECKRHTAFRPGPSPEAAKKISASLKGRRRLPLSAETREKIGAANRGRRRSAEFSQACRDRQTGSGKGFYYSNGYRFLRAHYGHPLANRIGTLAEHRKVAYETFGDGPHPCHWCGVLLDWGGTSGINIDHLNGVKDDNRKENLVISCLRCNRIGMRKGDKNIREFRSCDRCGRLTMNIKFCSRRCANVR